MDVTNDPIMLLPEVFKNEDDMDMLDRLFDRVAAESRWSNRDVARAICKMLHYMVGDGGKSVSGRIG